MRDFEQLSHTADIQLRVFGTTMAELFCHALVGMFQSIKPQASGCVVVDERLVCPVLPVKRTVALCAGDREQLLVDFLSEALYLSDVHNEAYLDAHIEELSQTHIRATLQGIPITGFAVVEIKAVTYHDLYVRQLPDSSWQAEIVFDI